MAQEDKGQWLTPEQAQLCIGYNDVMLGQPIRRGTVLYHRGVRLALHDESAGVCRTGREVALEELPED